MATKKQQVAAKKNIKKAQAKWKSMTHRQHALAQPEGMARQKPGTTGKGKFFRIEVRPKSEFKTFRIQDVGRKGGLERLAGRRSSGSWDTVAWLVSKEDAKIRDRELIIKEAKAKSVLKNLRGPILRVKGDIFKAYPRANVPESSKPTLKQKIAQRTNIKKAQLARWK
ncbi:MAG: hypothetical protein PHT16_01590 [Candidatus Pacebacteria bacterium]|nr:hypothetical protein [Candidatus Paceibacterota bacterium]